MKCSGFAAPNPLHSHRFESQMFTYEVRIQERDDCVGHRIWKAAYGRDCSQDHFWVVPSCHVITVIEMERSSFLSLILVLPFSLFV